MSTHTEMLAATLQRHVEQLELQQARFGLLHTPAYILTDIELTRAEIARLGQQRVQQVLGLPTLRTPRPAPMPGLIVLVSPRRADERLDELSAYAAIEFHRTALKHCWMIATSGAGGSFATAQELAQHFGHYNLASSIWQVIDPASIAEIFALVDWLYTQRVPASGLSESKEQLMVTHQVTSVNGIRLHSVSAGSGKPIVFLHGHPDFWYLWKV